ncbi:hypothetical protein ASE16_07790 [Leifsonia sp. Root227]|uniref:DUF6412 domain-containing protein n=1 Tax=unclassified Leifsonia TaxID=2663824 RepID=UPI0006F676A5|nr:DUF6412 domain-containing protein [Leifsonia sp. Root227]KRC50864.1 hypothetical protein ASE16_07790 [Leifsonia sp. Root227]
MLTFFELLGRLFATSLENVLSASTPASIIALAGMAGAIGLVAVVAAAGLRSIVAIAASLRVRARLERPIEPADKSAMLSQSDPDADGRPRPRAPGIALQTA